MNEKTLESTPLHRPCANCLHKLVVCTYHQSPSETNTYVRTYVLIRTYLYVRTYVHKYIHTAEEGERRTMPNVAPPSTPELLTYVRICVRTYVFL